MIETNVLELVTSIPKRFASYNRYEKESNFFEILNSRNFETAHHFEKVARTKVPELVTRIPKHFELHTFLRSILKNTTFF